MICREKTVRYFAEKVLYSGLWLPYDTYARTEQARAGKKRKTLMPAPFLQDRPE